MNDLHDVSTERLLELREQYRTGQVMMIEREPDTEARAELMLASQMMLEIIEVELQMRLNLP
jgi:hypothetical protein